MLIGIFRNRLRPEHGAAYEATAARMDALVGTMPGYLWHKTFRAEDGERVTLFGFESLAQLEAWRDHPEHREAQRRGRVEFYAEYSLHVCTPLREAFLPARSQPAG
jgi:heme-degrading monooxygenase HmoA